MSATTLGWLILLFPLVGTLVNALLHRRPDRVLPGLLGTLAIAVSFACAVAAFITLLGRSESSRVVSSSLWSYATTVGVDARLQILIDPLSILMALVVTGVSTLIHLYSVAYLKSDRGYARFFSYLNFFVFSMLVLVLAGNFLLLIVGWAFVGAASYLLISFWYRRTTATRAGMKAFVINVLGDVGLVLGTFFIFRHTGTLQFIKAFHAAPHVFAHNSTDLTVGCLLVLVAAAAKSAQVPLHTWLPDAMEGPTPVSALIHAATMVTAGVYLIARMHILFELSPTAADVGAIIGCLTLLIAATIAIVQTDLKRVIAYSTMSQIGYMFMAVCAGAYSAGLFHLITHAFFKALLFMAAGSVISAMGGEQSMDRMSGFRKAMPFTFACFLIGGLALAGMPPFSGWLSKDDIIGFLDHRGGGFLILGIAGYVGALLTGVYTFRMIFRVFFGEPCEPARELEQGHLFHPETPFNPATGETEDLEVGFPGPEHHIAEHSPAMAIPMAILALLAVIGGALQIPGVDDSVESFLKPSFADSHLFGIAVHVAPAWVGLIIGALIAVAGIGIAYVVYRRRPGTSARLQARFAGLHTFLYRKWYFDELIDAAVVRPTVWVGRFSESVLERGLVAGALTGGTVGIVGSLSATVRRLQNGFLRYYAAAMLVGIFAMSLYFLIEATG